MRRIAVFLLAAVAAAPVLAAPAVKQKPAGQPAAELAPPAMTSHAPTAALALQSLKTAIDQIGTLIATQNLKEVPDVIEEAQAEAVAVQKTAALESQHPGKLEAPLNQLRAQLDKVRLAADAGDRAKAAAEHRKLRPLVKQMEAMMR